MSRITAIRTWRVDLPLRVRLEHASAREAMLQEVLLGIGTSAGGSGIAEIRGNGAYATGADVETVLRETCEVIVPVLINCDLDEASARLESLRVKPLTRALADSAVHDARGRESGISIRKLLGGRAVEEIPVHAQIGFCSIEEAIPRAVCAVRDGFRRLKLRLGRPSPEADIALVRALREAIGDDVMLAVDANGGWDVETASLVLRGIEASGIAWAEQPTPAGDDDALRDARASTGIPVIGDEAIRTGHDIERLHRGNAIDGVHLKLEKAGTVANLIRQAQQARTIGLQVCIGQMDQGRLGSSMTTHLAASIEADAYELWGFQNVASDIATGLEVRDGCMMVPDGPGNGVTVDMTRLDLIGEFS